MEKRDAGFVSQVDPCSFAFFDFRILNWKLQQHGSEGLIIGPFIFCSPERPWKDVNYVLLVTGEAIAVYVCLFWLAQGMHDVLPRENKAIICLFVLINQYAFARRPGGKRAAVSWAAENNSIKVELIPIKWKGVLYRIRKRAVD